MSTLLKSNLAVAAGTAMSRVTGLVRVAVFGAVLGRTAVTDAYNQANATPNLVYELLLGGVLSSTLVPLFTRLRHEEDDHGEVAVRSTAIVAAAGLTVVAVLAAPWIFRIYAATTSTDVDPTEYRKVGGMLAAFFLIQIFFYALNAIGSAELQARRRYFAAAWAPAIGNAVVIATLFTIPGIVGDGAATLADVLTNDRLRWTLGFGATAGIIVMALALLPPMSRAGVPMGFSLDLRNPAVKRLRALSGWALGYVVANQVAIVVVQNLLFRSGERNTSVYADAFTFFMLPHGLLAMSIVTTFLPEMAQAVNEKRRDHLIDRTGLGIRLVALLTVPAGFGLFALRRPIVGVLLQHGEYTAADALLASRALAGFALGLGAFSVYLFTLRAFYAHQDARTPCIINIVENGINVVLALVLYRRFGVLGIAASFAIAYLLSSLWALQILAYKVTGFPIRATLAALYRVVLAAVVMAEAVWFVARAVGSNEGQGALVRLVAGTVVGIAVYVGVLLALKAPELDALVRRFRRRPAATGTPAN
ncbi:MAG: murein biosynthesis integral membrane protein MurJ [Ilumatobacter sp.]|nr:murein biosynthesis integral membrane protein MurJ [Ilumatobacter sp.]MCB0983662.1 murein biosynthesis integral membrane protein MurJ [Ilumatobacter sp.]